MRIRGCAIAALLGLATVAPSAQLTPAPAGAIPGEILVRFRPDVDETRRDAALKGLGAQRLKRFRKLDIDHVRVARGARGDDALSAIAAHPDVAAAQPNFLRRATAPAPPNDPFWLDDSLWGLAKIQLQQVWTTYTTGSSAIVVADIDSGVKYDHPDLAANMWVNPLEIAGNGVDDDANGYVDDVHGINALTHSGNPMDDNGHGTHTSGTFGAVGNNAFGVTGVNWAVKILACKFLDSAGNGTDAGAIECFDYITDLKTRGENIRVSNNSWGGYRGQAFPQLLKDAVDAAGAAGIVNIAAAGNDGVNIESFPHDPASFTSPSIVSVAASNSTDGRPSFTNYGNISVDLAAPGVDTWSTYISVPPQCPGTCFARTSGTSMATPHVAGVAALLVAQFPQLTVAGIKSLLLQNVTSLGGAWANRLVTSGRLNAWNAATALNANTPPTVAITSPLAGAEYNAPASVDITANAADTAMVTSVEFFANGVALGSDTTAPYSITAGGLAEGTYSLTAKATDNLGATALSAPVPIVVHTAPPSEAAITLAVTRGGTRLQQLQNADGGWYFRATDTGCFDGPGVSCPNLVGIAGLGLLSAYGRGGDAAVLADAVRAGQLLVAIHDAAPAEQPYSQDLEFLRALSTASGDPQYAAMASTWFETITAAHPVPADRVDWQFSRRQSLAVWDLASLIRSAKAAGRADYATALAARIVAREADWKTGFPYSLIGMGSLLWAMHDLPGFTAQIGEYRATLLSQQSPNATWGGGSLQTTAYIALGLGAVGGPGTSAAIQKAVQYFIDTQLPASGWPFAVINGVPGAEFSSVDSEVARAIDLLYSTGQGSSVTVAPAQLAAVTFESVGVPGLTSIVATDVDSQARVPNGYSLVGNLTYAVTTTANVKGTAMLCLTVPWQAIEGRFDRVRLLQPRHKKLVDQTITKGVFAPDAASERVCAELSSLAPVSIALLERP